MCRCKLNFPTVDCIKIVANPKLNTNEQLKCMFVHVDDHIITKSKKNWLPRWNTIVQRNIICLMHANIFWTMAPLALMRMALM